MCFVNIVSQVGRDFSEIRLTWSPEILIRSTEPEVAAAELTSIPGQPSADRRASNLIGKPEQVAAKIQKYVDLGCRGFVPWCTDYPDTETLEHLATEVMPAFRG